MSAVGSVPSYDIPHGLPTLPAISKTHIQGTTYPPLGFTYLRLPVHVHTFSCSSALVMYYDSELGQLGLGLISSEQNLQNHEDLRLPRFEVVCVYVDGNNPDQAKDNLEDSKKSFQASISLEGKPMSGDPPETLKGGC